MSTDTRVRYEERDAVGWITLDCPSRLNAVTPASIREIVRILAELTDRPSVRAVALTGTPPGFCTGADVHDMFGPATELSVAERTRFLKVVTDFTRALRRYPRPVLAVMGGPVAGGAIGWSLACDLRIASKSTRFVFGAFSQLGINAGGGTAFFVDRMTSLGMAARLLFVGEEVPADRALELGLVDWVVEDAKLREEAERVLRRIVSAPLEATMQTKRVLNQLIAPELDAALDIEAAGQIMSMNHEDARTALAAFKAKKPAFFEGAKEPWIRSGPIPGGR